MSARDVIACFLDHPSVFMGGPSERNQKKADAILAALSAAGWLVVPVEPTQRMVNRGLERADIDWRAASEDEALCDAEVDRIYRAMIAAAQEDK